jgi:hypothetical protein
MKKPAAINEMFESGEMAALLAKLGVALSNSDFSLRF